MTNLTTKQQLLVDYDNIITKNKKHFKVGQRFTRNDFIKMFSLNLPSSGTYKVMHRANLKLVQVQNMVNMLMRENGLYIKSEDYYNEFVVVEKDATKDTILRYRKESETYLDCNARLSASMGSRIKAGTWGTYNKVGVTRITNMNEYQPSTAYKRDLKKIKHW